jgi:hypothetical protein
MCEKKKTERALLPFLLLEPVVGVEPTTCCLRNRWRMVDENARLFRFAHSDAVNHVSFCRFVAP